MSPLLLLLIAATPQQQDSYKAIMDCLGTTFYHDEMTYKTTGRHVNDSKWIGDMSTKSLHAMQREGISSTQYKADMDRAMDLTKPPALDAAAHAACKAHFGYKLNG